MIEKSELNNMNNYNIYTDINNSNYMYIYSLYKSINNTVDDLTNKLHNTNVKLENLIKRSGPQDVQAQQYDTVHASRVVVAINDLFQDIENLKKSIDKLNVEYEIANKAKINFEKTCITAFNKLDKVDTEFLIFIHRHIKKRTLYEIAALTKYEYGYVANISSEITKKINKCELLRINVKNAT